MAELASSMAGMLLPNHFQPLDHDSESDNESIEYGGSVQIPFSSMSETSNTSSRPEIKSSSPNVTVEYLPHMDLKDRTEESWSRMDSSNLSNDSGFTPNSSGFSADLSSSGGFSSSCDLSLNSKNSSLNYGESFRTQELSAFSFDRQTGPVTPTKLTETNQVQNDDPLTPTANLKMLLSAMSPEIRNMENKKKKARLFDAMVEAASQGTLLPGVQGTVSCTDLGMESSSTIEAMSSSTLGTVSPCNEETVTTSNEDVSILNTSSGNDSSFLLSPTDEQGADEGEKNNRKSKSLGLLCQKFLTKYPDYPPDGKAMDISLDQISKDLNVERRRIYDIVNVLESVEMVSRRAKNRYLWHGRTHLNQTLAKLKCLGQRQKFAEQLALLHSRLEDGSLSMDDTKSPVYGPDRTMTDVAKQPLQDIGNLLKSPVETEMKRDGREHWEDGTKRDKTLGVMSQKFIMLFLVCKDRIISLDVAARILKGDQNYQIGENAKFKTKVRRLYDIANILTSLKLIDKIHLSEGRSRKPAFRWIGPDPDTSHVDWSELPTGKKPTQKHSYFPLPPVNSDSWSSNPTHKQTPAMVKLPLGKTTPLKSRIIWSRNASFSAMCEVAEQERRKYSSAPNSPVKDEDDNKENGSTSTLNNGNKKDFVQGHLVPVGNVLTYRLLSSVISIGFIQGPPGSEEGFIQEFQALRNKYPVCVSRLFSGSTGTSSDPSPLTSDPAPLTPESFHRQLSPRDGSQVTTLRISSPGGQGDGDCTSASKTKSQKLVYVQRFVPLLNANTIAAVQASSTHQTDTSNPAIMTGNRTIVTPNSNSSLVSGPHPAVISPTPGSVIHLLPMRQDNWVKLPNSSEVVSKSAFSNGQHSTTNSVGSPEAGETQVKCPVTSSSNQVVTIIRRSKRAVKLALDKEFEYHPLIKKVKSGDRAAGTTVQNPPTKVTISEPTKNSTVIITHPTLPVSIPEGPHPQAHTPVPHPQKKAGPEETGRGEENKIGDKIIIQETPFVRNDARLRRAALKHVKRRLTIDLDKEPSETRQGPTVTGSTSKNASKKMPRCHSLSELDKRKGITSPVNGLVVPYLETNGVLHGKERVRSDISMDEAKRVGSEARTPQGHNYSSNSVKMKFGGKFGSLKKNVVDAMSNNPQVSKTSDVEIKGSYSTERSSGGTGPKCEGSATDAQGMRNVIEKTENRLAEMAGNVNLEDCWLSASFPPPSLSGFSTFLQGCSNRVTPRPGSSRPSSVVSIGELDRWLFPGDNASPSVTGGQPVKTVSTPWVLSPTVTTTYSSPPKLTTQASPAGHGVALASPRPLLPKTNHPYLSPHHPLADASSGMCPEPLFTSTPKSPKPSAPSIRYFSSDVVSNQSDADSVTYSGDDTTPYQPVLCPQDQGDDLGKLKPLEGIPLEQHSAHATKSQNTFPKQPEMDQVYPKEKRGVTCHQSPGSRDESLPIVSTGSSQTTTLPPYLMRSKALAAAQVPEKAQLHFNPVVHPLESCSSNHGLVNTEQVNHPSIERLSDLQIGYLHKDSPMKHSAAIRDLPSMHQLQTISSTRVIKALPKPPSSSLQRPPWSPDAIPVVKSGHDAVPSDLRRPPLGFQIQQQLPRSQFRCTLNGTPYTFHVRPYKGNPMPSRAPKSCCIRYPDSTPTAHVNTWDRCHREAVSLMRSPLDLPHPLQGAPGPSPGCTPRFTTQVNPTPATKNLPLGRFPLTSRASSMIAQEACGSTIPGVTSAPPPYRPWTLLNQTARSPSVSTASVPHTGQNAAVVSTIQASGSNQI